ncbi:FAD-dependent oxidoreductase [Streptomyces sp. SID13666]|uniref:NAD(P)/FAD-dependent oxidoreductase n=1 Tax=unclassified Streptomyces TaxID=2593676 RepID=UPI0013BFB553|nr:MULTISPECIES: tryptophan 7-halogenase [unclassified Streptomyces]NEA55108.1 FAD-dependent oxidoreductase [Streptomyces sp. SID13666]NEA71115.1 FAD-dependent oxidoreductase [Streptomyces sp. SID13588]
MPGDLSGNRAGLRPATPPRRHDVIILGSGIAGATLGAILAKQGVSVLLLDGGTHPRFAVGESTTLYTLKVFRLLARRYGVPELESLTSYQGIHDDIAPTSGTKRHFGFIRHEEGKEPDPAEFLQFSPPSKVLQTGHLFRQDTDAYLFHAAVRYGCDVRQAFHVEDVELKEHHVAVVGKGGERYEGRYLVDASGFRSPIAKELGLRKPPEKVKHHSRSMFTHMLGVRPTDECLRVGPEDAPPIPWVEGTMHHLFDRGWFWSIPFNNAPGSRNPLVSVGLTLDERMYPKNHDVTPEEEFRSFAARFPAVERLFADAKTVRPWVSADRIQYASDKTVGHRWCLMSHAAGFIDPLYSRGLTNTGEVVNSLAWRLLDALAEDDFDEERFRYVDELQQGLIRYNDELVNCSFISFKDHSLWNAVYRIWCAAEVPINLRFDRFTERFADSGDDGVLRAMEEAAYPGLPVPGSPGYKALFDEMVRLCEAVDRGEETAADAGKQLLATVTNTPVVLDHLGLRDPGCRFVYPMPDDLRRMAHWLRHEGPDELRYLITGVDVHGVPLPAATDDEMGVPH